MITKSSIAFCSLMAVAVFLSWVLAEEATPSFSVKKLPGSDNLPVRMASYYGIEKVDIKPAVPQYDLPLDLSRLSNAKLIDEFLAANQMTKQAGVVKAALANNGFVRLPLGRMDDIARFYEATKEQGQPIFITSDSLLHLYHIQFDETLREVEEREFFEDVMQISKVLQAESLKLYRKTDGQLKKAAELLAGYATVPVVLLAESDPATLIPKVVDKQVRAELDLIAAHRGFNKSPLFLYKEDYSQYVPRGHYTRSKKLEQYFKAMMWYGRMTFLIRGSTTDVTGAIPLADARIQTLAACALSGMMETRLADGRSLASTWDRVYAVTAYYVGLADDLTPYEYRSAIRKAVGENVHFADLTEKKKFFKLRKELSGMRKPQIYSGLGDLAGPPVNIADEKTLAEALAITQGLRLMGQRYVPDSYMMGQVVYPAVGVYTGDKKKPFTYVISPGGPIRGFPRGLDVMSVLGSSRARYWLKQLGDDQYEMYDKTLGKLQNQFGAIDQAGWNRNMYWSWLYVLKALLKEYSGGYPSFMQTDAWQDKQLSSALASWSQLRHDTILYAKQSYTMRASAALPKIRMIEGYVEPVPEFYARLLALTRMTRNGLDDFKVLDDSSRRCLTALEDIIQKLLEISQKELSNQKLTEQDYDFIRGFGSRLKHTVAGVNDKGLETTIVADVHTDGNTGMVLEEGTGNLHPVIVIYPMPDGGLVAGVGPVLSHYEFKQPMSNRLTDEAWKKMLRTPQQPALPPWTQTFTIPLQMQGK